MPYWVLSDALMFPHPLTAGSDGILAMGGDLSLKRLILAYTYGVFPWYGEDDPVIWWFPDPRCVMKPADVVVSKSMRAKLSKELFAVTFDTAFREVITRCSSVLRKGQRGTWIHPEMVEAYCDLHNAGYAHSVEVWQNGALAGGLYGVAIGKIFFGESMFSLVPDSSKYALISLARFLEEREYWLIDCQENTKHLRSMGAGLMPAQVFHAVMEKNRLCFSQPGKWISLRGEQK